MCSAVTKKEVQKRAKFINDICCLVAGSSCLEEQQILYIELIKVNKDVFKHSLKDAGFDLVEVLTPMQTINMQTLLRISSNNCEIYECLSNFNLNVLASERKMSE